MPIKLSVSNSLESLVVDLGEKLQMGGRDVFVPYYIITQTDGINIWLKEKLALHLGIVANINFKKPNDLIFRLYSLLGGKFLDTLSRENLVWLLYQLMGEDEFSRRFPIQAAYFQASGLERDLKRMGLAEKLADLLDQYQIFRPEMIKEWNGWELDNSNIDWQSFLWIKAKSLSALELPDKTVVHDFILEQLKNPAQVQKLQQHLPTVYLFGLSIITRYHMDIFTALAEVVSVQFYLLNPAPEIYWIDDRSEKDIVVWRQKGVPHTETQIVGNPLLTAWGKVLQNTFRLLFRNDDLINNYEILGIVEPQPKNLLKKIQWDIFENAVEGRKPITASDIADESIVINSCYTVAREVEVLYQYLVHLVDAKHVSFSSRDIVVMVSNIDLYAPYIKAVFDNAFYTFKYKIADVSITQGDNLITALQAVLQLNETNFTGETVMQLLDAKFIKNRFKLNDIDRLRELVSTANIRFGIHGAVNDETNLVSWTYGLKRMMLGICMSDGAAFEYENEVLYPLDIFEGSESWEVIRFVHFIETLTHIVEDRNRNRSISSWVKYIENLVHDLIFLPDEEAVHEEYAHLLEQLKGFNQIDELMLEALPYGVFSKSLLDNLSGQSNSKMFHNDGITFCSFIPMRSIPFKVVAMLGMNQQHFPRKENALNFNLINKKHELGDRNIKDNDKHLFLETLLSAKEFLYISYLGKSLKDNTVLPASILAEELLDYIQSGLDEAIDVRKAIVVQQPLHEFGNRYNQDNPKLYRYADGDATTQLDILKQVETVVNIDFQGIYWRDVIAFYKNSVKAFYNKRLGIYYNDKETNLAETELFELDKLQEWNLKQQLLAENLDNHSLRDDLARKGELPLKHAGTLAFDIIKQTIEPVQKIFFQETDGQIALDIPYVIQLGDSNISGKLNHVYNGKLVQVCWSSNLLKYLMEAYLNVLIGVASGHVFSGVFIYGKEEPQMVKMNLSGLTQKEAIQKLMGLTSFYKQGMMSLIPFVEVLYKQHKVINSMDLNMIQSLLESSFSDYAAPNTDAYLWNAYSLNYFNSEGMEAKLQQAYALVVAPLFQIFPGIKF